MKRGVVLAILAILLSLGFFLGLGRTRADAGQTAAVIFEETAIDNTVIDKGDNDETPQMDTLTFGLYSAAERLRDGGAEAD